jgi:hypothetical protein
MSSATEDPSPTTQRKGKDDASFENVRGGGVRLIKEYQFGSPVRMYINAGNTITIRGDSQGAWEIYAVAVGRLVSM